MIRTAAFATLALTLFAVDARAQFNPFRAPPAAPQVRPVQYPRDYDPLPLPQPRQPLVQPQYPQQQFPQQQFPQQQFPQQFAPQYPQQQFPQQPFGQPQLPQQPLGWASPGVLGVPGPGAGRCEPRAVWQVFVRSPRCHDWHLVATLPNEDAAEDLEDDLEDRGYDVKVRRVRP